MEIIVKTQGYKKLHIFLGHGKIPAPTNFLETCACVLTVEFSLETAQPKQ